MTVSSTPKPAIGVYKGTDGVKLELQPIRFDEACEFVRRHHRHHRPPQGFKFCVAVNDGTKVVGVAIVGHPVARLRDNGWTLEVTRCCTDGTPHACSMLYSTCWRAARAMGYKRLITYILATESGTSLKAAGWKIVGEVKGCSWSRARNRFRVDRHPVMDKLLWEADGSDQTEQARPLSAIAVTDQSSDQLIIELDGND